MTATHSVRLAAILTLAACGGSPRAELPGPENQVVVLVSIDGFRADFLDRPEAVKVRQV